MKKIYLYISLFVILFTVSLLFSSCQEVNIDQPLEQLNTNHLDYLYEEIKIDTLDMAVIHIYADYPSYNYIDDEDEGMACVDDAARAAIFYLENYYFTNNAQSLIKNKKLLEFLIYLQAENGYFYNFIWSNYSINTDFKTSVAEPNWWSWRALWALTESYPYYKEFDHITAEKIKKSIEKLIISIKKDIPNESRIESFNGLDIPSWLPNKYASDQASVLVLGLVNYYSETKDEIILEYIKLLCDGIMKMQIIDRGNIYYGTFLSWQNIWHAYGNSQAYALLIAYQILENDTILEVARKELDYFYPTLIKNNYVSSFNISIENETIHIENENKYSQIAYNKRPMIYALLEAYKISKDEKYAELAGKIGRWFLGDNTAKIKMYDEKTGIVFDGIESEQKVNMNSGAESTIEALLSLQKIMNNKTAFNAYKIE